MTNVRECAAVTVVIPCCNQARFLPAAVASVRAQRYRSLECIVVNDGSTDDTARVASDLGVHLVEQPNRGVAEARNAGLAASRSELVVFLDADDELLRDAVSLGAEALASDPTSAAVVGRCQVMDSCGNPLPARRTEVDPSHLYEGWLSRNFVWTPGAAMFRTRALQEIGGFPPGLGPAADYAVYLRLARTGRVRVIADDLVRYRQHEASMSRNPALMLRATLAVLQRECREVPAPLRSGLSRGRRSWCDWYGEQVVERLRCDWHARRRGAVQLRAVATLLRHCPGIALRHLGRMTGRLMASFWRRPAAMVLRRLASRRQTGLP
jgi:glycosyltransferase involved in cell wall biosynthesis